MIGKTIGDYLITEQIGSGGVGDVYAGVDLMLEREVAIKVLKPELLSQANVLSRFRSEAIILAKLNHPNIASVYAFLNENKQSYLVMERVCGWPLQQMVNLQGCLPLPVALSIIKQTLTGLSFAHQHRVIHRDLKPANVMLTDGGIIKVMDFGVARVLGSEHLTRSGYLVGTPEYMSPEQICGKETDVRSDIYSLGILMYELLTGQVPFTSHSEYELMKSQVETIPPLPEQLRPETPPIISNTIMRALSKTPEARFQSANEMALALECYELNAIPECDAVEIHIKQLQTHTEDFTGKVSKAVSISQVDSHPKLWNSGKVGWGFCHSALQRAIAGFFQLFDTHPWLGFAILMVALLATRGILTFDSLDYAPEHEVKRLFPHSKAHTEPLLTVESVKPTVDITTDYEPIRPLQNTKYIERSGIANPVLLQPGDKMRQRIDSIDRKNVEKEGESRLKKPSGNSKAKGRLNNRGSQWVIRR